MRLTAAVIVALAMLAGCAETKGRINDGAAAEAPDGFLDYCAREPKDPVCKEYTNAP